MSKVLNHEPCARPLVAHSSLRVLRTLNHALGSAAWLVQEPSILVCKNRKVIYSLKLLASCVTEPVPMSFEII